jgi:anti-sigma factor RsiW
MTDKSDQELDGLLHTEATRYALDDRMRAQIHAQLLVATAAQAKRNVMVQRPKARQVWAWVLEMGTRHRLAMGFLLGVLITWAWMAHLSTFTWQQPLDEELVAQHVHALRFGPLYQVQSSDRHTVKPWFQGKLDYAPPVIDLASEDFPLLGGRVDHVDTVDVAAMIYGHRGHLINLFVWPSDQLNPVQTQQNKGFNLAHWSDARMQYWVVTDMDATELGHFVQGLQAKAGS